MDSNYSEGVLDFEGNRVIRPLNNAEKQFLSTFYKEFHHAMFVTSDESKALFRKINSLLSENASFYKENGFYPVEVENLIADFDKITKQLGNMHGFWQQKDINSDDYKRGFDVENKAKRDYTCVSYEDLQEFHNMEEESDTKLEDLITESEE